MVKKILAVTTAIALMMLYSCAGKTDDDSASGLTEENITVTSAVKTEGTASVSENKPADATSGSNTEDIFQIPGQGFIGVWSTDESNTDQILIYEITPASVKFNTGINGLFGFDATAMFLDNAYVFGDGISPGYSGPDGLKGKLEFSESSITVTYEDFGSIEGFEYYPDKYTFTIKDENSDSIVSQYIEAMPS